MPRFVSSLVVGLGLGAGISAADDPAVVQTGWRDRLRPTTPAVCPPVTTTPAPAICPPGMPVLPGTVPPSTLPSPLTPTTPTPTTPTTPTTPRTSPETPPPIAQVPPTPEIAPTPSPITPTPAMDLLAQGTERGAQPVAAFRETMFGDLLGVSASVTVLPITGRNLFPGSAAAAIADQTGQPVVIRSPISTRYSGVKIGDNESPKPQDRLLFSYNYFYGVNQSLQPAGFPRTTAQRQVMGFEKTFLDGDVSIGIRQPFIQVFGDPIVDSQKAADLTIIFKGRLWENEETGDLLSVGMALTVPSGGVNQVVVNGVEVDPKSTLFQPFAGFILTQERSFIQGFGSIVVPNRAVDTTLLFNSIGAGYWLYREPGNRFLTGITPVAEVHVSTPLNNRSPADVLYIQDQANLTTGSYFTFHRFLVGTAFGIPMVGPRPWNYEWLLNMNYRF